MYQVVFAFKSTLSAVSFEINDGNQKYINWWLTYRYVNQPCVGS